MLLSAVVAICMVGIGIALTTWCSDRLRFEERIAGGVVLGVLAVTCTTFLAFELIGMGWPALSIGLLVPAAPAVAGARRHRDVLRREARVARERLGRRSARPTSLRPFLGFTIAAGAVSTRVLALSYQTTPNGISAGSLAIWGDWSAHLAYAGSFAYGDNRGLDLPIATGTGFRYHFLADFFGSLFTVSGATLQQSMALSAWLLAVALPPLLWCAVMRLVRSRLTAALTLLMFTLSGGIGVVYFLRDVRDHGWTTLTSLPQTYARMPDQHLWVDNTISASLYAQRSTLLGFCTVFFALVLLLAARPRWSHRGFAAAGVMLGVLGIAHAHGMLTGLALGGLAMVVDRRRDWLWFLVPLAVVGLPLAWAISPEHNSIRFLVGWMAPGSNEAWPWFWLRNVGLFLPIFAGLSLLGGGVPRLRRLTTPLWLWFIVPNIVAFHPSEWNNTKYFVFWQFAGCLLIASWLSRAWHRRATWTGGRRLALRVAAATCVGSMIVTGGLDTVRAMQRSSGIPWVDADEVAAAAWLRGNTRPDDVLVYAANNTSAAAALGGRRVVSGYPGWTWDLGLADWGTRRSDSGLILSGGAGAAERIARYGVDLVLMGPDERRDFAGSDAYWAVNGQLVFQQGEYRIYRVPA